MKTKKLLVITMAAALLAGIMPASVSAQSAEDSASAASVSAKEEVVYAKLTNDGDVNGVYVVNCFDIEDAGTVSDLGEYISVVNLTDSGEIEYSGGKASFTAENGRFYYQGDMDPEKTELPWIFDIGYTLDGKEITADKLAGGSGLLEITIGVEKNPDAVSDVFYENYLLQVTLTLDSEKCSGITAKGATIANAGGDKQVVFSVLPGSGAQLVCSADAADFEMPGISIAGMPYSMDLGSIDISGFTDGLTELSDGIAELDKGVAVLRDGVKDLNSGVWELSNGASKLEAGAVELETGAAELAKGFETMNSGLAQLGTQGEQLAAGASQIQAGLDGISQGINGELAGWSMIEAAFSQYGVSLTYKQVAVMDENDQTLQMMASAIEGMSAAQIIACAQMKLISESSVNGQLIAGVTQIADNYSQFAAGITQYTGGVSAAAQGSAAFAGGLAEFESGVSDFSTGVSGIAAGTRSFAYGTNDLYDGVAELKDGTGTLREETADMPDKIEDEMDSMLGSGEFEPVSFVNDGNENVGLVQFVFTTEAISEPEAEQQQETPAEPETFWDRVKALFTKKD